MEGRRTTRGRPRRVEEPTPSAPSISVKSTSPGRTRRSSRPRSATLGTTTSATGMPTKLKEVKAPTPIKEVKESPKASPKYSPRNPSAKSSPTKTITLSSSRVPVRATTTSSVHSSFSTTTTTTHKTVELRSTPSEIENDLSKLTDYIRRSVSKTIIGATGGGNKREGSHTPTTTNTELESRYSRSVSRSVYDDDNYSKAEFSDNEELNGRARPDALDDEEDEHYTSFNLSTHHSFSTSALGSRNQECRQLELPREFGGWLGACVLMACAPALAYYLQWCCDNRGCKFKEPNWEQLLNGNYIVTNIFRGDAVMAFILFQMLVFLLSAVLFGRGVRLAVERNVSKPQEYMFNLLPMTVLVNIFWAASALRGHAVMDFLLEHQWRFCIYGVLNAFVVALWCYLRADMLKIKTEAQLNVYGKTGNWLIDYALGRQINPKWLELIEFKQVFYRASLLTLLLYAECYLFKQIQVSLPAAVSGQENALLFYARHYWNNLRYDPAALLTASMLLFYVLDAIIFEHHMASSFELQGEGFGCLLLLRYAVTPYLLSAVARYFSLMQRSKEASFCMFGAYAAWILLLAGLALKRVACAIKYKYRVNPSNEYFNGIETIHTFQGKRLLLGGIWGRLRQPNYAGDLLALCGLALPLAMRFAWPPLLSVLLVMAVLLHRAKRVHVRNTSRYHSSWVRYCNQVRYYVLPHVY